MIYRLAGSLFFFLLGSAIVFLILKYDDLKISSEDIEALQVSPMNYLVEGGFLKLMVWFVPIVLLIIGGWTIRRSRKKSPYEPT